MFAKSKIAVFALTLGTLASTTTHAAESSVERYVTTFVNQAMVVAKQELRNDVRESVINSAQKVNFNGLTTVKTQVTITDIKTKTNKIEKANKL
ncbi:hypothetical protein RS130_03940 [Paraglaciecola aquimarina]|uniref:Uncharacterized protein n=1 Tax=Paraglaciecola aquimarina TaxID=1235557 RepID=A0ABU3ST56_9ALTE|nr:hypothetical protein [Paraglaciecola aquimarina]MDU0353195.1 hypothetical protein [Paraglaciecola aquimarina]